MEIKTDVNYVQREVILKTGNDVNNVHREVSLPMMALLNVFDVVVDEKLILLRLDVISVKQDTFPLMTDNVNYVH